MNGVVIIDKPSGKTSHDVVAEIRKVLGIKRVGHTGTLDPLATGVLPVCINEATKMVPFFENHSKDYRATMLLGVKTDTLDTEGTIVNRQDPQAQLGDIERVFKEFVGEIEQIPPQYSAVKFQGKPLYKWARKGITVVPLRRKIEIFRIAIHEMTLPYVTFGVSCSKGTYIRSLCADIGDRLGCGACLSALRRTRSGSFDEKSALALDGIDPELKQGLLKRRMIRMADTLPDMPSIQVDELLAKKIQSGYQPTADIMKTHDIPFLAKGDMVKFLFRESSLVAVVRALHPSDFLASMDGKEQMFEILRVFNSGL
jgi:tRNA pseudouridine55 synthase